MRGVQRGGGGLLPPATNRRRMADPADSALRDALRTPPSAVPGVEAQRAGAASEAAPRLRMRLSQPACCLTVACLPLTVCPPHDQSSRAAPPCPLCSEAAHTVKEAVTGAAADVQEEVGELKQVGGEGSRAA